MFVNRHATLLCSLLATIITISGCSHLNIFGRRDSCNACEASHDCADDDDCGRCQRCGHRICSGGYCALCGWCYRRSGAIPQTLPLGSTVRAHYQVMQTNGEAADFILHRCDFIGQTAELSPDGKDQVLEIAARMRSVPFPVIVERSENNSDPELDALRRNMVARILTDHGNPDAEYRTVVSTSYGPGYNAIQAEPMYYRHVRAGGLGTFGTFGNNAGLFGGFGGGGGGGLGFGP